MKQENRETLQRAAGILEGVSVSGDLSTDMAQILINVLCEIEDKICEGRMVELPCEIGQTVYHIRRTPKSKGGSYVVEAKVWSITTVVSSSGTHTKINIQYISRDGVHESADSIFGKYAFATPEEANKKLKELENEQR